MTKSGLPCQFWKDFRDNHGSLNFFPEGSHEEAKNYCRDPSQKGYIWCYTTNPMLRFEECALQGLLFDFSYMID
jgi:hypothetical protein